MVVRHLPLQGIEEPLARRHSSALVQSDGECKSAVQDSFAFLKFLRTSQERYITQTVTAMGKR
jgi:hypothetical protein